MKSVMTIILVAGFLIPTVYANESSAGVGDRVERRHDRRVDRREDRRDRREDRRDDRQERRKDRRDDRKDRRG